MLGLHVEHVPVCLPLPPQAVHPLLRSLHHSLGFPHHLQRRTTQSTLATEATSPVRRPTVEVGCEGKPGKASSPCSLGPASVRRNSACAREGGGRSARTSPGPTGPARLPEGRSAPGPTPSWTHAHARARAVTPHCSRLTSGKANSKTQLSRRVGLPRNGPPAASPTDFLLPCTFETVRLTTSVLI